jgi:uncharacterized protein YukE
VKEENQVTQVHANPEDIQRFARCLKQFNQQLSESMSQLNGQFDYLSYTWQDQKHQKFAQEFIQTMSVLRRFLETSEQHIPFLFKEAEILNQYLGH